MPIIWDINLKGKTIIHGDLEIKNNDFLQTIEALKRLLIMKEIFTENELEEYLNSMKVLDKINE